jgi:hypothetical protein
MSRALLALLRCRSGAAATEFAIVLPALIMLLFGTIDAGRFLWEVNSAEKATQAGARLATVTDAVSPDLIDEDYAGDTYGGTLVQPGGSIPAEALGSVLCTSTACSCEAAPCPANLGAVDSATFNNVLVARMQLMMPSIAPENVEVRYSSSGLGTAGSIGGGGGGGGAADTMEVSPLITVSLKDMEFTPLTTFGIIKWPLPAAATTLPAEDVSGEFSE